jgi:hypothetical protein
MKSADTTAQTAFAMLRRALGSRGEAAGSRPRRRPCGVGALGLRRRQTRAALQPMPSQNAGTTLRKKYGRIECPGTTLIVFQDLNTPKR